MKLPDLNGALKNLDLQTIGAAIAAVLAVVGLIVGVSVKNDEAGGSSSTTGSSKAIDDSLENPPYVRDFSRTAVKWLEAQGYTVTQDANKQAKATAEGYFEGDSMKYDVVKFRSQTLSVAPAFFPETTQKMKNEIPEYKRRNSPNSRGEAGVAVAGGPVYYEVVILQERDDDGKKCAAAGTC